MASRRSQAAVESEQRARRRSVLPHPSPARGARTGDVSTARRPAARPDDPKHLVDQVAALCVAQRVLLLAGVAGGWRVAASRLPSGERASTLLRAASAWRYHTHAYTRPVELNFLQRAFRYQRPETTGF